MNFQDILKIKTTDKKVLFWNKLLDDHKLIDDLTYITNITKITENYIYYRNDVDDSVKVDVDESVQNAEYFAKYSSFTQLVELLLDDIQITEDAGSVSILSEGKREYTAEPDLAEPVIYFWISEDRIFYVGKAGNGWSNRSKQHQNGWKRKAKGKQESINISLLENIFPENKTENYPPHEFAVVTIPVKQLTIENQEQLEALSPFENEIPSVSVNIIDELEKIFIFICQPQINNTHKNGAGVNFEILQNIL